MIKSYFKTAIRFLLKNKAFSFINILGLAIGTMCCLYIVLYVKYQYSYDKHYKDAKNIYRINTSLTLPGGKHDNATSSPPIAPAMKKDFAEVVQFTRFIKLNTFGAKQHLLKYKEKSLYEKDAACVDSTFFDVFNFHFVYGSAAKALSEPYSIVLNESVAEKLFGKEDPVGKVISIDNSYGKNDFKITGVVDESLGKSHLHTNIFIVMNSGGMGGYTLTNNAWAGNNYAGTYVKLNPKSDPAALEKKLPAFLNKYGAEQLKNLGMTKTLKLQPIGTIHTTTGFENEPDKTVSSSFLYILLLIAIFIQVIACINFMNLSTARASQRAKEVGVRKVIGARRGDLVKQFIGESLLISLIAVLVALPLLLLALPYINHISQIDIQWTSLADYRLWLLLLGIIVLTGLIAGSYPAFYLSAFMAVKVIKGNFTSHMSATTIRRSLVVFQFALSIILIISIIVIYSQLDYIKKKDLGFDKDQKLIFTFHTSETTNKISAFSNELKDLAEVKAVSRANNYLSQFVPNDETYHLAGGDISTGQDIQMIYTDKNFAEANGIKLVSGRDFRMNDTGRVLINETLANRLGLKINEAPGTLLYRRQDAGDPVFTLEIAGVMKDFNYNSLHEEVDPFMLVYSNQDGRMSNVTLSSNSKNYAVLLNKIETIWKKHFSGVPFEYSFLDNEVQKQYETEITLSRIINLFTLIAIFISCLGLFGLAAFSAEQRRKEIGIRKVLGASVGGIVQLLSKDFLKLVGISFVIAAPLAGWAMHTWLQNFAYRITISWWMLLLAGVLSALIVLLTISFQSIKAAITNPVKSLRSE